MKVLITGGSGQLAMCLSDVAPPEWTLDLRDKTALDITDFDSVADTFDSGNYDVVINCAAYTNVDGAEEDRDRCYAVNVLGASHIARCAELRGSKCIHISTDYVYHSTQGQPLKETDETTPKSVYAQSKLNGESKVLELNSSATILRTSWLYSEYGNNFFKTMRRLALDQKSPGVVSDQLGTPTYARDLAEAIVHICTSLTPDSAGIFNFSNTGQTSWHGFASEVFRLSGAKGQPRPISTAEYPTAAIRPEYSTMDLSKFERVFGMRPREWQVALQECFSRVVQESTRDN